MRTTMLLATMVTLAGLGQARAEKKPGDELCRKDDECNSSRCRLVECGPDGPVKRCVGDTPPRPRVRLPEPPPIVCPTLPAAPPAKEDPCPTGKGCPDGSLCRRDDDCQSGRCVNGKCASPTCGDGVKNDSEVDVDCGFAAGCPPCRNYDKCDTDRDCLSGLCRSHRCQPQTCDNKVQDGDETGVDCGGRWCPPCPLPPGRAPPLTHTGSSVVLTVSWGGGFIGAKNSGPGVLRTVQGTADSTFFGGVGLARVGVLVDTWPSFYIAVGVGPTESSSERGGGMAVSANAAVLFPLARWVELGPQAGYLGDVVFDLGGARTSCGTFGGEAAFRATSWLSFPVEVGGAVCYDRRDDGSAFFGGYLFGNARFNVPRRSDK